jgi:hypothetical protein
MRLLTIVACLLLLSPPPVFACLEHAAEQTGWLHEMPSAYRHFAGAGAEESSMLGVCIRPGEAWLRVDPGHGPTGPRWAVEDEEALPGALAIH